MSNDKYYLSIAKAVSKGSRCLKMKVGSVIVKNDCIIATGFNSVPEGDEDCKECPRMGLGHKTDYTLCPSIHSEVNAIISAARNGVSIEGGTIYVYTGENLSPCYRCNDVIRNSGIKRVIYE